MQTLQNLIYTLDAITWLSAAGLVHIFIAAPSALHVLMYKDNERAAVSWIGLILLSPFVGSALYWLFGINRVKRQAQKAIPRNHRIEFRHDSTSEPKLEIPANWLAAVKLGHAVHQANFTVKNMITPLLNGDEAYREMIKAIDAAESYVMLSSYIFVYDRAGRSFVKALGEAHRRGVQVRVLIDGVGIGYSWQKSDRALKKQGVRTARFLPTVSFSASRFINLRNHRKILSIDGRLAFMGGMNISADNLLLSSPAHPVQDIHFMVKGPVIDQVNQVFTDDWQFAAKEVLQLDGWKGPGPGTVTSRVLPDGPDADHEKLTWALIAAINCAQKNIRIATPYFIPGPVLISALQAASLRGVCVEIIVPQLSNIPFFDWAMLANLPKLTLFGMKVYKTPHPFDHSKLFMVDDIWSFIGSSNWDARSLELNFEVNLECYDCELNRQLTGIFDGKKASASLITEKDVAGFSLFQRLRNNLFRLMSPYL